MPAFLLQRNVDGEFVSAEQWNTGYSFRLLPADALEHTISAQDAHLNNAVLLESLNGESGEDRRLWHMNVDQETTVNGPAAVHLRIKTQDIDKELLMAGAVLVDQADEPFPCFDVGSIGVLDQKIILENGVDRGKGTVPYHLVKWTQKESKRKIISYGTVDLRNPEAGYTPATSVPEEELIQAGEWYDYTIHLQPAYYTVVPGHHLELYIVPFCGFQMTMRCMIHPHRMN